MNLQFQFSESDLPVVLAPGGEGLVLHPALVGRRGPGHHGGDHYDPVFTAIQRSNREDQSNVREGHSAIDDEVKKEVKKEVERGYALPCFHSEGGGTILGTERGCDEAGRGGGRLSGEDVNGP